MLIGGWCTQEWPGVSSWPFAAMGLPAFRHQYGVGVEDEKSTLHQIYISSDGCNELGWCSHRWPGLSPWAFTPECRIAYRSQFEVFLQFPFAHQIRLDFSVNEPLYNQFNTRIDDGVSGARHQYITQIDDDLDLWHQYRAIIDGQANFNHQVNLRIDAIKPHAIQFLTIINTNTAGIDHILRHQYLARIDDEDELRHQFIVSVSTERRAQHQYLQRIDGIIPFLNSYNYQSPYFNLSINGWCTQNWPGLDWPFTAESQLLGKSERQQYLVHIDSNLADNNAEFGHQFAITPTDRKRTAHQFLVNSLEFRTMQNQYTYVVAPFVYHTIDKFTHQFNVQQSKILLHQWEVKLYNTTHFRLLWEFASDGNQYNNIGASTNAGQDFEAINLKNDLVEHVWRSADSFEEWIQFDCGQGVTRAMDTIALIATNLSPSAIVRVYGFGTAFQAPPASDAEWYAQPAYAQIEMPAANKNTDNVIWIAPEIPTVAYRYWRIRINDETNTSGYIEVGRMCAGEAMVFVQENYQMEVDFSEMNYKDEMELNGFSSVARNRALKRKLRLTFDNLNLTAKSNYTELNRYLRYCRDTLKALVIPDPSDPYLYSTFAKLSEMPSQRQKYIDDQTHYSTISLEWDESK